MSAMDWVTKRFRVVEILTGSLLLGIGLVILVTNLDPIIHLLPHDAEQPVKHWLEGLQYRLIPDRVGDTLGTTESNLQDALRRWGGVSLLTAFLAGLLSFLSPCVLPLVPAYISFISGVSIQEIRGLKA